MTVPEIALGLLALMLCIPVCSGIPSSAQQKGPVLPGPFGLNAMFESARRPGQQRLYRIIQLSLPR